MGIKYQGTVDPTHSASMGEKYFRVDTKDEWINTDGGTTWKRIPKENDSFTALPKGYFDGLQMSFNTVAKVDIAAGACRDTTNAYDITPSAILTADIAVSGKNGLDTGTEAADTWYAVHVIGDTTGVNAPASLLSLSATAPTQPSGYDVFRRVGWVRNNGSSAFINFVQRNSGRDRKIIYNTAAGDVNVLTGGTATVYTDVDCSSLMPSTADSALLMAEFGAGTGGTVGQKLQIRGNFSTFDTVGSVLETATTTAKVIHYRELATDGSQIIEYNVSDAANNIAIIRVYGYIDEL